MTCSGVVQLGWAREGFAPDVAGNGGVGDCGLSWAFDGARSLRWHGGDGGGGGDGKPGAAQGNGEDEGEGDEGCSAFGRPWVEGDVVGAWLHVAGGVARAGFSLNGEDLGEAFRFAQPPAAPRLFAALSLDAGEVVRVNAGQAGFAHACPVAGAVPLFAARGAPGMPAAALAPSPSSASSSSSAAAAAEAAAEAPGVDIEALLLSARGAAAPLTARALLASGATLEQLRAALAARGLKVGGGAQERAERLLAAAGARRPEDVPHRLRGPNFAEVAAAFFANAK